MVECLDCGCVALGTRLANVARELALCTGRALHEVPLAALSQKSKNCSVGPLQQSQLVELWIVKCRVQGSIFHFMFENEQFGVGTDHLH